MRYCKNCTNYTFCERQGTDIPDHIVNKQGCDVIHLLCHDFKDSQLHRQQEPTGDEIVRN